MEPNPSVPKFAHDIPKPITLEQFTADISEFWQNFKGLWSSFHNQLITGDNDDRDAVVDTINGLLSKNLSNHIKIEISIGMLNHIIFEKAKHHVELYLCPRLLFENVPIMELMYKKRIRLPNLTVVKYKAYHPKDELIKDIETPTLKLSYIDIGCQTSMAYDEQKLPVLNLVIYVKKPIADHLLTKQPVRFRHPDGHVETVERWLPTDTNVIDILLLNVIGEYNFIHHIGYIDFLPEGDPLIAEGSVFNELSTIRDSLKLIHSMRKLDEIICHTCARTTLQTDIRRCSRCKKTYYCGLICQSIDFPEHKKRCAR
jgi:hypothetical protein